MKTGIIGSRANTALTIAELMKHPAAREEAHELTSASEVEVPERAPLNVKKAKRQNLGLVDIHKATLVVVDQLSPMIDVFFEKDSDGVWQYNAASNILIDTKNKERIDLLAEAIRVVRDKWGKEVEIKKAWLATKLIKTRFTNKGIAYIEQYDELNHEYYTLASILTVLLMTVDKLLKTNLENATEIVGV